MLLTQAFASGYDYFRRPHYAHGYVIDKLGFDRIWDKDEASWCVTGPSFFTMSDAIATDWTGYMANSRELHQLTTRLEAEDLCIRLVASSLQ